MTTPTKLRRALVVATLSASVALAAPAEALDKNDIINMQAAGLGADVIVSVIRSSTDPLTVTPGEVEELRMIGVPAPVLDEICLRVGCGAAPVGPVGGGGMGPDLQREMELRQQQEQQRLQLEQQRMEAERQRMREQIEAEQNRQAQVNQAFEGLATAERFMRAGQYDDAASVYRQFLDEVNPAPGSNEYTAALTGFVRSMYRAGYRYSIRLEALEAVLTGTTNPEFEDLFAILSSIATESQFLDPQFERLTDFQVGNFDTEFQDEWNYFLGRFFWVYGQYPRANEFLSRISTTSDRAGQAHYLSGVMALEERENRRALQEFRESIVSTETNGSDPEVGELANLAIARLAYEVASNDVALYHYRRIPVSSSRHPRAVFEMAWTYLMKQDWNRAIGTLHALHSPYYDDWFFPELYVMEAFAYLQTCNLEAAEAAVAAHQSEVNVLQASVNEFIAGADSAEAFWEGIATYYDRLGTNDPVNLPIQAVRSVLSDAEFVKSMELIGRLQDEQERLTRDAGALGAFGNRAVASLDAEVRTKIIGAGLEISAKLSDFSAELTDWNVRAQEVGIELRTELISRVDSALTGDQELTGSASSSVFVLAADWQYWPFEGEYWADEVDNYRADISSLRDETTGRCIFVSEPTAEVAP
ncbi:MAG: hypothetical protein H6698_01355 [Myxococcales bacterium]|nr:hypothetical protein [Myxococcales bacterium]MCB9531046.1 hypothetical protein [Myxococcales bacterium]MCB9532956.1 hypothetical protein [Myxococcales bacterium]